jgi:isoleucyl-tRNA synthetase
MHQLVNDVEHNMDAYNIPDAMTPILPFLDDASNWFVRRSRRRFWKSEETNDKEMAYKTLHYVLVRLAYVLAPFTPFLADELYHNLTGDTDSIHLKDWMPAGQINQLVVDDMEEVRGFVNEGLSLRAKAGLKVRQPLASVSVPRLGKHVDYEAILQDELNVKKALVGGDRVVLDETMTPELKREGLVREVIRHIQAARKSAGLNVDDRIHLELNTEEQTLQQAIVEHKDTISAETLVKEWLVSTEGTFEQTVTIETMSLTIRLAAA